MRFRVRVGGGGGGGGLEEEKLLFFGRRSKWAESVGAANAKRSSLSACVCANEAGRVSCLFVREKFNFHHQQQQQPKQPMQHQKALKTSAAISLCWPNFFALST